MDTYEEYYDYLKYNSSNIQEKKYLYEAITINETFFFRNQPQLDALVTTVIPQEPLPKLPVARALWIPKPDFETAVGAWILAGGAHHTVFSQAVTAEFLEDFAEIAGIELLCINETTTLSEFKKELRWNESYFQN